MLIQQEKTLFNKYNEIQFFYSKVKIIPVLSELNPKTGHQNIEHTVGVPYVFISQSKNGKLII